MKRYLIGMLIVLAAGAALFLLFNQGLFTASDEVIEPADDAPIEEASVEESEPDGSEDGNAANDAGFTITDSPFQDFNQARAKGEPIVLKFYSET